MSCQTLGPPAQHWSVPGCCDTVAPTHRHKAGWARGLTDPSGCCVCCGLGCNLGLVRRLGAAVLGRSLTYRRVCFVLPASCCSGGPGPPTLGRPFVPTNCTDVGRCFGGSAIRPAWSFLTRTCFRENMCPTKSSRDPGPPMEMRLHRGDEI